MAEQELRDYDWTSARYVFAKQHRRAGGGWSWGVFDNETKQFVEGGFFSKAAARFAAVGWNEEAARG